MEMKNLTGQRFGRLTALSPAGKDNHRRFMWKCVCDCGRESLVRSGNLVQGNSRSCGCQKVNGRGKLFKDITGQRFGRLVVISRASRDDGKAYWECVCDCGATTVSWGAHLRSGHTSSCGCFNQEQVRASIKWKESRRRGPAHHNWNPNFTEKDRADRRSLPEIKEWLKAVLRQHNYTCNLCGKRGGKLAAHHLNGYNWAIDQRTEVDNGVPLCPPCHKEFHDEYGLGNNTTEQYEEFKKLRRQYSQVPHPLQEEGRT